MNNENNYAISIDGLKKTYNLGKNSEFEAIKGINLKIPKKSIFGLLGANGAGKSTLINIIAGLVSTFSVCHSTYVIACGSEVGGG